MQKAEIISEIYERLASKKGTKKQKVVDIKDKKALTAEGCEVKKNYVTLNYLKKQLYQFYFPTDWLFANESAMATRMYDWKIGGMVHLNDSFVNKESRYMVVRSKEKSKYRLVKIDLNSSYPSVMNSTRWLCPIKRPLSNITKRDDKLYQMFMVMPKRNIKTKRNFMPLFSYKIKGKNKWLHDLPAHKPFYIDSNQWDYFAQHYNRKDFTIKIECSFTAVKMNDVFGRTMTVEYANKQKYKNKNVALYNSAKIILNSIYGKWVTKYWRKNSYFDEDTGKWTTYQQNIRGKYMPIGIAVLNVARLLLCEAVANKYHLFKYCDTDSLMLLMPKENNDATTWLKKVWNITTHPTELGAWDLEGVYDYWAIMQPKRYLIANKYDDLIRKMAGYRFAEMDANNDSLPNYGTKSFKEKITQRFINECIYFMIEGGVVKEQTARLYMPNYGVRLTTIEKEVKPIYNSYLSLKKDIYYKEYVI